MSGINNHLTLEALLMRQAELQWFVANHYSAAITAFFFTYIALTALSIPGAAVMTLIAGALFGLTTGTIIVSFASTIGATLAFLFARFLLRDYIERHFSSMAERIATGIKKDGAYYLFTLRLVPVFPFFIINLALGLTRLKTWTFAWVSQIGMLAGTLVFVNAGTQISRITNMADIASPRLLGSFVLLGIFPLLTKKIVGAITARHRLKKHKKLRRFDANL